MILVHMQIWTWDLELSQDPVIDWMAKQRELNPALHLLHQVTSKEVFPTMNSKLDEFLSLETQGHCPGRLWRMMML